MKGNKLPYMTKPTAESVAASTSAEMPNPTFDEGQEASSLPGAKEILDTIGKLGERLDSFEKRWQSDKDRRIPQIEEKVSNLQAILGDYDNLVKNGTDPELAKWLIERLEARVSQAEQMLPQETKPSINGKEAAPSDEVSNALAKLEKYGLSVNEKRFIGLLQGHYPNKEAFRAAVNEYILERVVPGSVPASKVAINTSAANEEGNPVPKNPIQDVEDSKTLYDMALKEITEKRQKRTG